MNSLINFLALSTTSLLIIFSCNGQDIEEYPNIIKKGDELANTQNIEDVKFYAETTKSGLKKIKDVNNFEDDYLKFYNVFENKNILLIKVILNSESGDYTCQTDYYYKKGELRVLINYCTFFNSLCEEVLTKKTIHFYKKRKLIQEKKQFFNENENEIFDISNCILNYSCSIEPIYDYSFIYNR